MIKVCQQQKAHPRQEQSGTPGRLEPRGFQGIKETKTHPSYLPYKTHLLYILHYVNVYVCMFHVLKVCLLGGYTVQAYGIIYIYIIIISNKNSGLH